MGACRIELHTYSLYYCIEVIIAYLICLPTFDMFVILRIVMAFAISVYPAKLYTFAVLIFYAVAVVKHIFVICFR